MHVKRIPPELAAAAAAGAGFAVVARLAAVNEATRIDRRVHDLAASTYHRSLELALLPIEIAGLPGIYIPLAGLMSRRLRRRHGREGAAGAVVGAAAFGWLALRATRLLFNRTRPPRPAHRGPKSESSFPSGHTTGLTALATAAGLVLKRNGIVSPLAARAIALGIPLVVGFNRVYVREHWLTDVVGGWLLGASVGLACVGIQSRVPHTKARRRRIV
jgi:membrane-associated phospholipid phosphatase